MKTGLRTEIVVSICILLGAALLFAGFLLLKLTEQELLAQKRDQARSVLIILAKLIETAKANPSQFYAAFDQLDEIVSWRLLNNQLLLVAEANQDGSPAFDSLPAVLPSAGRILEDLSYSSEWLPGTRTTPSFIDLSTSIGSDDNTNYLLQVRFSLEDLARRIHRAQKMILIYVCVYGGILLAFGVVLLNRQVVLPIQRLHAATADVAAGKLAQVNIVRAPAEITDLAASFNHMIVALEESRGETDRHIQSLQEANLALKQVRDDLIRSEKMATVGHLAAGMAHEVGNPLGALIGYLGILESEAHDQSTSELLKRCLAEAGRIDALVRELLDYARPGKMPSETFCAVDSLREAVEMLTHQGQFDKVRIRDCCHGGRAPVCSNRRRLQQVWVNLLLNARDAMLHGGEIQLTTTHQPGEIALTIADQGSGISEEAAKHIFEPFFTTKSHGRGFGLGLAICQQIITELGGSIVMSTQPGHGAAFTVSLPTLSQPDAEIPK
ncbi:MAG: HAMP domain-containing histidine kinase [Deltaproteobacteria bacterium]|jgi:signal transduction histidine kinase|nr:HAMP domain-containing histidine kinase [Deltaproteobacteria bacterium]